MGKTEKELEFGVGADLNGEEGSVGEEEMQAQAGAELGGVEGVEEEENLDLDWKTARSKLKDVDASVSWSIDDWDKRSLIEAVKKRFNNKERTQSLFDAIEAL